MNHSLLKSYQNWLNESLSLFESRDLDPAELFKNKDRNGLVELARSIDSEEVKSHPAYLAVMEWWKRGQGDLGLIKRIIKSRSARKTDKSRSLKSIYYWTGSGSALKMASALESFYKVAKSVINNAERLGLDLKKAESLSEAVNQLKELQTQGFVPKNQRILGSLLPVALVDNKWDTYKIENIAAELDRPKPDLKLIRILKFWKLGYGSDPELSKDPGSSWARLDDLRKDSNAVDSYWSASIRLSDSDKLALLDGFKQKADSYVERKIKSVADIDSDQAIGAATDLYIAPKNEKIEIAVTTESEQPESQSLTFSYPADPEGNTKSPEFNQGLSLFPDDGVTLNPKAAAEMKIKIKEAVDSITGAGGKIKSVTTWGYSSTSRVNSQYRSASGATGNQGLAQDRLAAINKAIADSIQAAGVSVTPTVDGSKNLADPNRGPEWTSKEANDPRFGKPGRRTPEYEKVYGPWRFAIGFFSIQYEVDQKPKIEVSATATPGGEWKGLISWADESISIRIPRVGLSLSGSPKMPKPGSGLACPRFK